MGAGASASELALQAKCSLPSVEKVTAAHDRDRYRIALSRHEEFLARERRLCPIVGFDATAPHHQPLMVEKMERNLGTLGDVETSHREDQRRCFGHSAVSSVAVSAAVRGIHALGDDSCFTCAADDGSMFVYNWREGAVVSRFRTGALSEGPGRTEGAVMRMCLASEDHSVVAAGDDRGFMALWDLAAVTRVCEFRLHDGAVTGLCYDEERYQLFSTSTDTYIVAFDLTQQQVVDRSVPKSFTDGCGVQNSALALSDSRRNIVLTCGVDGKIRIWSKDLGRIQRQGGLTCDGMRTTQCLVAPDGHCVIAAAARGDPRHCAGLSEPGGLLFYDLRKLSDQEFTPMACVAKHVSPPGPHEGAIDLCLASDGIGKVLVLSLMDGLMQAFRLSSLGLTTPPEPEFTFDVIERYEKLGSKPSAIGCSGNHVCIGTTAPSVGVWRRTYADEVYGHSEYRRPEPLQPMVLETRVVPTFDVDCNTGAMPGAALDLVTSALLKDQHRLKPFEAFEATQLPALPQNDV
mmetsp:Transcript_99635/g.281189  ORF Transcript_99635/g.281189 Transcript_99635/m.281189 type:complete len:518 (-) Transcript_99635:119-1672(-)